MDDTSVATVLPKELRLGVPAKMPQARSYMFRQQSTLQNYDYGKTITINIPRLQRSYLRKDSYLRFRVNGHFTKTDFGQALVLDTCGAYGFFEKMEVFDYLGSTVLESISGAPQLASLLLDMGMKEIADKNNGMEAMGLGPDYSYSGSNPVTFSAANGDTAIAASASTKGSRVCPPASGLALVAADHTTAGAVTGAQSIFSREFSIPLLSFLGLLSQKMIPLHNGFTIVLTVSTQNKPMFVSQPIEPILQLPATAAVPSAGTIETIGTLPGSPVWQITDVFMQCQILELGPVAESMILSSTQGSPLVVHTKSFRNYVGTVSGATWAAGAVTRTGQQEFVLNMNLNVASLTNILWFMRPQTQIDSILFPSCGGRTRNFLQRWQFQYGSTTLPQNNGIQTMAATFPVYPSTTTAALTITDTARYRDAAVCSSESFQELMKSRPISLSTCRLNFDNYNLDASFNANLDQRAANGIIDLNWQKFYPSQYSFVGLPRFAAGLNLQLMNGKEGDIISGLNTNGMNTSIRGNFHPSFTNYMHTTCTVDAYAEYDAFVNISPGIATTVSF